MSGTALTSKSDGVSCVSVAGSGEMIVYGGASADRVWCLDTASMKWRAAVCGGEVPQARKWHSAVEHGGEMFVFGGETANGADDCLYSLGLTEGTDRFVWECIHALGPCPAARSHHTAVVQDGYMYVFGGKVSEQPTVAAHRHMVATGFYDAYRIHLDSCVWERLAPPPHVAPPHLWGHSATNFRHFILYYGGFELAVEEGVRVGGAGVSSLGDMQPPTAHLNEVVHIYNTHKKEWTRSTPKGTVRPPPRALHNAVSLGSEMFVFGGIGLDHASRTVPVNDFWSWDVATGRWTHLPFCLKHWKSARLLHSLQHCFLYVLSDLSVAHRLDLRVKKAWTPARCDVSGLAQAQAADAAAGGAAAGRARRRHNLAVEGRRREEVAYEEQQRAILRDELGQRLREELESADGLAKATHVEMLQRQIGALRGQMEELTVLQRTQAQEIARARPEQLPQLLRQGSPRLRRDRGGGAASPQRAAAAAAATPVGSPTSRDSNPAADAALASQVSKLVDAVSRLKAIGTEQAPPPSAAAGVAASLDPHAVAYLQQQQQPQPQHQQQQQPLPPHYYQPGAVPLQQTLPQPATAPVPLQGYYSPPRDNSYGVGAPQNVQDLTWLQQQIARPSVLQQQMGGGGGGAAAAAAPSPSPSQQYSTSPSIAPWPAAAAVGGYPMAPQQQHLAGALPQQQYSLPVHQYAPPPPPPYAHPSQVAAGYQQFPPQTPPSAPYQPSVSAGGGGGVASDTRQPPLQRSDHLLELQKHLEVCIKATHTPPPFFLLCFFLRTHPHRAVYRSHSRCSEVMRRRQTLPLLRCTTAHRALYSPLLPLPSSLPPPLFHLVARGSFLTSESPPRPNTRVPQFPSPHSHAGSFR